LFRAPERIIINGIITNENSPELKKDAVFRLKESQRDTKRTILKSIIMEFQKSKDIDIPTCSQREKRYDIPVEG
jgi:hypothetical protein